jgi:hypothetical protein
VAGLAGAGGFDGGVQGQQVGLAGDVLDQLHHGADLLGGVAQAGNDGVGLLHGLDRLAGDVGRLIDLASDLGDRGMQLLGGGGDGADAARGVAGGQ